jgi:carbon-monoxide dehydrogenase medium subunit
MAGEVLTRITIPVQPPARLWSFREYARRQGDYALAGLAAQGGDAPRIVWFGLADRARRDPAAEAALAAGAPAAAIVDAALDGIDIASDTVTGDTTRRHLARVLLTRTLRDWGHA